jgi:hypothetical protein
MELKMMAEDKRCGFTMGELRRFVSETEDWPDGTWLDCYVPQENPDKPQVAPMMGIYAGENMNCPRCGTPLRGEPVMHSLSRVDNSTRICSECGNAEAIFDMLWPGRDMPPVDQRIDTYR